MTVTDDLLKLKVRVRQSLGYADRRVRRIESMTGWTKSTGRYHSSCAVTIAFPAGDRMAVVISGDAPSDAVVMAFVVARGGSFEEHGRGGHPTTGRSLQVPLTPGDLGVLVELADLLDGLPARHNFDRDHYFYEARKAATRLREFHALLDVA